MHFVKNRTIQPFCYLVTRENNIDCSCM